jgi:hypothetical protein
MVAPRTGAPEIAIAEEQEEYLTLTGAVYGDNGAAGPVTLLTRWRLSDEDRARIAAGEDLFVALQTFGRPLHPMAVQVGDDGWRVEM